MPTQRKTGKKLIGGYLDGALKEAIDKLPEYSQTIFLELSIIRGLIRDKAISKHQLREMAESKRLNPATVRALQDEKLL